MYLQIGRTLIQIGILPMMSGNPAGIWIARLSKIRNVHPWCNHYDFEWSWIFYDRAKYKWTLDFHWFKVLIRRPFQRKSY